MKMIKLTLLDGTPVRVNPEYIRRYNGKKATDGTPHTEVDLGDDASNHLLRVTETPGQIDAKIAEISAPRFRSIFEEIFGRTG